MEGSRLHVSPRDAMSSLGARPRCEQVGELVGPPVRIFVRRPAMVNNPRPSALRRFLDGQSSAGLMLMGAAALALVIANSSLGHSYQELLHAKVGPLSVSHWINDGLMAFFRSEEHTSELQSLMRISYSVFCLKKKKK